MKNWILAGHTIEPCQKKQIILQPNVEGYEIPATMIYGKEDGMTLVITASIHSGEYPGVLASTHLASEINPENFKGRLLVIHCVNTSGFWTRSPGLVPEDGKNLNRDYPGKPNGTTTDCIADFFVKEIFNQTDFMIDLHSGGQQEHLTPCLFFPVAAKEEVTKKAYEAALATDIPYLIASSAATGQYSYAATSMDIPGLLLERGHSGRCREEWVSAYHRDLKLLLAHFGMINNLEDSSVCIKKTFHKTIYQKGEHKGLWRPLIKEGQFIKKGELLGYVEDFGGNKIGEYHAKDNAIVFYHKAALALNVGEDLVAYGLLSHME